MVDINHLTLSYTPSEQEHRYGSNIHLLSQPFLQSLLARLCDQTTGQPAINWIVEHLYQELAAVVVNAEFEQLQTRINTRMIDHNPEGVFEGDIVDPDSRVVLVDLARAGMLPSFVALEYFNHVLNPSHVRLDHIFINRAVNEANEVIGTHMAGHKIGGDIEGAMVLFPDPMGATGGSMCDAVNVYKSTISGTAKKLIALHLIITPEYVHRVTAEHPDLIVYALRLDRGLSDAEVLASVPGAYPEREKGLNEHQYIVPGAGGLGEIINNSYV